MSPLVLALVRVPLVITPAIAMACERLSPGESPTFVQRAPAEGALINKCTFNARRYLEVYPGEMVLGWEICVWDNVMLDCIGHAVIRNGRGLTCVTPSKYSEKKLLFLPDPKLTFDFDNPMARMPTKQMPISIRPEVRRLITVEEQERTIKFKFPVSSGDIMISSEDAFALQRLAVEKQKLMLKVVLATNDHVTKCFCGSGKKFRKCHKAQIEHMLQLS